MKILNRVLSVFLFFIAITSLISGLLLMVGPGGEMLNLPLSLLDGTAFRNFLMPGILLFAVVGGVNIVAALINLQKRSNRYNWAAAGGLTISGWIIAQVIIIHTVHWLHVLCLAIGITIILLSVQLKGKWVV